jgi:hypothetical protein
VSLSALIIDDDDTFQMSPVAKKRSANAPLSSGKVFAEGVGEGQAVAVGEEEGEEDEYDEYGIRMVYNYTATPSTQPPSPHYGRPVPAVTAAAKQQSPIDRLKQVKSQHKLGSMSSLAYPAKTEEKGVLAGNGTGTGYGHSTARTASYAGEVTPLYAILTLHLHII